MNKGYKRVCVRVSACGGRVVEGGQVSRGRHGRLAAITYMALACR